MEKSPRALLACVHARASTHASTSAWEGPWVRGACKYLPSKAHPPKVHPMRATEMQGGSVRGQVEQSKEAQARRQEPPASRRSALRSKEQQQSTPGLRQQQSNCPLRPTPEEPSPILSLLWRKMQEARGDGCRDACLSARAHQLERVSAYVNACGPYKLYTRPLYRTSTLPTPSGVCGPKGLRVVSVPVSVWFSGLRFTGCRGTATDGP